MSGDPKQDFFADGITEQIITELARFRDLRVISRNSTFTYKGKAVDVREVGRHMAARYVVEGSVQRRKKRLRVTAQLLDTHSGAHLWADAYDRDLDRMEVFDVQDDIVQHVVAAIADAHGAISRATFEEGKSKEPERLDAYVCVLRYYGYVRVMAPAEHARVRDCLEYAVKVSPDYAEAWAGLADVYGDEYVEGFNERPEPLRRSLKAAQRAVALDPASPRAHMVLAKAHFSLGDRDALVPALERAIALNPNNAEMLAQFGVYWTYAFFDDRVKRTRGVDALRKAIALTPVHPGWYYLPIAYDLYERGEYDSALREAKRIDMPDYVWANEILVLIYGAMGRKDDARASIAKLLELYPDFPKNIRKEHRKWVTSDAIIDRYIVDLRRAGLEVPDGV